MGWSSTHQKAVESTTRLVVEICHQMEDWRRLLRHIERIERQRQVVNRTLPTRTRRRSVA